MISSSLSLWKLLKCCIEKGHSSVLLPASFVETDRACQLLSARGTFFLICFSFILLFPFFSMSGHCVSTRRLATVLLHITVQALS